MDLKDSLSNYSIHLASLLQHPDVLYRFKCLSGYDSLGCFCAPESKCHVDIIRNYLKILGLKVPKRTCVKAKFLRKLTIYDNLREWCVNPKNHLCTRRGRIFIGSKKKGNHRIYHYQQSEWHNPYKIKK